MILECKGGPHDGLRFDMQHGHELLVYGTTLNGRRIAYVYKLAFEGNGKQWVPFLDFFATDVIDTHTCERIERRLSFAV